MATNITYLLNLDPSGALKGIQTTRAAFDTLDSSTKQLADNFNNITKSNLQEYVRKLKQELQSLKDISLGDSLKKQINTASNAVAEFTRQWKNLNSQGTYAQTTLQKSIDKLTLYREGLSKTQQIELAYARSVQQELTLRKQQEAAYASLSPKLKELAALKQKEQALRESATATTVKFQEDKNGATTLAQLKAITDAYKNYATTVKASLAQILADKIRLEEEYTKELSLLQQLKNASNAYISRAGTKFAREGQRTYDTSAGASKEALDAQNLKNKIDDLAGSYARLQARTRERLALTDDPAKIAKINSLFEHQETRLKAIQVQHQKNLGEIEKNTKGVHQLDIAHKPFLERILDLVVGYKLINAAVNTFTNALRSVPEAGLQFETTYATLKAVFSVTTKVNQELKFLDELAQSAGISIDTLRSSFVDFAASAKFSGEKVENIQEIFANISKAGMVLHLPADKMKSAFTALNQMYAKNQVMMEELKRQLGNQLPAAVNIFALSMGKTTRQLMDDMKKGLVVPKETILNFSRTYAAMFADPASLEYASQGVNAHIQRLSTAWTNFANKVYEESKGGIKGGLAIATNALVFLKENMTLLVNSTTVLGSALGIALVSHIGTATKALLLTRNAAIMASASMLSLEASAATVASLSLWANIKLFAAGTIAAIPPWMKLVAVIGTAVMVLKDLEVSTVKVMSSFDQTNGKAIEVQKSITVSDIVMGSWHNLYDLLAKIRDILPKAAKKAEVETTETVKQPRRRGGIAGQFLRIVHSGEDRARRDEIAKSDAEEITRQTEYLNERVKETLLAGTSGTVDETMAGMNKSISTALGRIESEFDRAKQKISTSSTIESAKVQQQISAIQNKEKLGQITHVQALKQQHALQANLSKLKIDTIDKEIALLDEKAKKEAALSDKLVADSAEARKYNDAYLKLGTLQKYKQEMPQALVDVRAYKTKEEAATALASGKVSDTEQERARAQYNATHLDHGFKKIEVVTEKAIEEANARTVETWKKYEAKMDAHTAVMMQVSEGVITTNKIAEEEKKIFEEMLSRMPKEVDTTSVMTSQVPVDLAGMKFETKPTISSSFISDIADTAVTKSKSASYFEINNLLTKYANKEGIDPAFAKSIAKIESRFNPEAMSTFTPKKGAYAGQTQHAYGVMQLYRPDRKGFTGGTTEENIAEGVKQLAGELKYFNGDYVKAAAAYNAGRNAVEKHAADTTYKETIGYVAQVKSLYQPTASSIKSGEIKAEDATAKTLTEKRALEGTKKVEELNTTTEAADRATESILANLETAKTSLQSSFSLMKTTKETELAKLDNLAIPLSDKQRLARTSDINAKVNPELVSQIDKLVANAKETITRTADQAVVSGLQSDILNLTKERAEIEAEVLKDKTTMELNKILPLQDALARRQFEIQKSLEESLGIYNEKTILQQQDLNNEELIKLVYQEKLRLADKNSGLTAEEVAKNTELLAIMDKQVKQLSQVELMKARIAQAEEKTSTFQAYSDAAAANAPINQASKMGVSGNFVGAMATEETARLNYDAKQANFEAQKVAYGNAQKGKEGTNEWYKLQTQIEQTTTAMNDLALAKDAVINQATADTMNSIGDHFVGWANGAETVKDAFKGIAIDFAKMVQEILMNELKLAAVKGIMSLISGGIGGMSGGGSLGSTGATSAIGIAGFATGGDVRGTGTGTSDSIPSVVPIGSYVLNAKASAKAKKARLINLSHGEVVISPEQVAQLGLDNLNTMNTQGYATGGLVGGTATSSSTKPTGKNSNVYNINVAVPEGTANPQQFGKDTGVEIYKAIAREEAKKELNRYNKMKTGGR